VPFLASNDAPWWVREGLPELPAYLVAESDTVPQMPTGLLGAPSSQQEPPCVCACCVEREPALVNFHHAPDALADRFAAEWTLLQQQTGRMWRAAAAMYAATGADQAEFVADDLSLITGLHRRSTLPLLLTGVQACAVPDLIALVEQGQLSSKHAEALLDEAGKWTDDDTERAAVLQQTLARCRGAVAKNGSWPTPGQLRRRLRTVALLRDLTAAEKAKRSVAERRGVGLMQTGAGAAVLSIEGPDAILVQIMDGIRARAETLGRIEGNTRSLEQRMFDAAHELLTTDADGGDSAVPSVDEHGAPVTIRVRGVEVSVVVPFSVGVGGDLELAEIPGFGSILPSTARELLAGATHLRRVAVDADTGQVIAVDDRTPGPTHQSAPPTRPHQADESDDPDDDPDGPDDGPTDQDDPPPAGSAVDPPGVDEGEAPEPRGVDPAPPPSVAITGDPEDATVRQETTRPAPSLNPALLALLRRLATEPVRHRDLRSTSYRVNDRIRRFVEHRDRSCTFPGCTVPGHWCDIDHREPWPLGPTDRENCHCVCRRHHRAKQAYFTVTLDKTTGNTLWTTPDGRIYRRPPPTF
jgi:hypothetical protein